VSCDVRGIEFELYRHSYREDCGNELRTGVLTAVESLASGDVRCADCSREFSGR
jgi:hypothetical protein